MLHSKLEVIFLVNSLLWMYELTQPFNEDWLHIAITVATLHSITVFFMSKD